MEVGPRTTPKMALEKPASHSQEREPWVLGNDFIKQPVLVARRAPSDLGPIVGAAATVAVLRQG